MTNANNVHSHQLCLSKIKIFEQQLDDVMELNNTAELIIILHEAEHQYSENPTELNKARLGIIYHETALNLGFFSKTEYKGYAQKSYDILSELFNSASTTKELMPFIASYRASALSLVCAESKKLKLLAEAFTLFADAVNKYQTLSYLPEFLRGSVAENLPWFFFSKRKFAKSDFQSIIDKQVQNPNFANWKIMSYTYWAWANQHTHKKYSAKAISYLDKAISLDPNNKAGRKKAEELKEKLTK